MSNQPVLKSQRSKVISPDGRKSKKKVLFAQTVGAAKWEQLAIVLLITGQL